ncbi:MAG: HAMP domain-containing histidine kinase [Bacteroidota bacterium]|nr:HAMP domain-containing histidine kinase [Bacteroidota bacterium]
MNLKLRFALLFSLFVAVVLLVSSATIYVLYYNYRESDFYDRVRQEGLEFYDFVIKVADPNVADAAKVMQGLGNNTLWDESLAIIDSTGKFVDVLPDTATFNVNEAFLRSIKQNKEIKYTEGERQFVCIYQPDTRHYIISSGLDILGLGKLRNLEVILTFVFLGGLLLTALFAFLFVKEAIKPLTLLSAQMQRTTELNLTERIPVGNSKDELSQIANNFNQMLERLNRAFETQKSFVHHASHELRTPLASMLSQTESALNKNLNSEEYKNVLLSLKEDQVDLIDITNSLLLLSQYEKINFSPEWPKIRIDEVMYDTISSFKKMFPNAEISFQFDKFPDDEDEMLFKGKDALLKIAFHNLIKNAVLYSANKGVSITVHTGGNEILVHFDSRGKVLSEEEVKSLMLPFFRGTNAGKVKGFGLGLSIVNRIINLHKGKVEYNFVKPDINRFTVVIPVSA